MNKYHNIKTTVDGITFDSKAEERYLTEQECLGIDCAWCMNVDCPKEKKGNENE